MTAWPLAAHKQPRYLVGRGAGATLILAVLLVLLDGTGPLVAAAATFTRTPTSTATLTRPPTNTATPMPLPRPTRTLTPIPGVQVLDLPLTEEPPQDITLQGSGPGSLRTLEFPVYPDWQIRHGSELRLALRYSPLVLADRSALTVRLGSTPLTSIRLRPEQAAGITLTVPIPLVRPADGVLRFTIEAGAFTSARPCAPPDSLAGWVVLGQESRLHLAYTADPRTLRLKDVRPVLVQRAPVARPLVFALPADPQPADWEAASLLAAGLGQAAGFAGTRLQVLPAGAAPSRELGNAAVIYLGGAALRDRLQGARLPVGGILPRGPMTPTFALRGTPVPDDTGILALAPGPWHPDGLALVVTGGSDRALLNAARALLDPARLPLLESATALVRPVTVLPPRTALPAPANGVPTTLHNLGFTDQTAIGVGTQSLSYRLFVPGDWTLTGDGQVQLYYNYARILQPERSSLTVRLNGIEIASMPLTDTTQIVSNTISLPRTDWVPGDNLLEFRFALHLAREREECTFTDPTDAWGTIYDRSALTLPYDQSGRRRVDLALYPYPFAGASAGADPAWIVLPDAPTPEDQGLALTLVAGLSRFTPPDGRPPQVTRVGLLGDTRARADLILLGGPERNTLSTALTSTLPIHWDAATARTLRTEWGVVFASQDAGDLGLAQELVSPWNPDRLVLDVHYSRPALWGAVADAVGRALYLGRYRGNVLVVADSDRPPTPLDTTRPAVAAGTPVPIGTLLVSPSALDRTPWLIPACMLLVVLVILVAGLILWQRRQGQKRGGAH